MLEEAREMASDSTSRDKVVLGHGSCSTKYVRDVRLVRLAIGVYGVIANCNGSFILRLVR